MMGYREFEMRYESSDKNSQKMKKPFFLLNTVMLKFCMSGEQSNELYRLIQLKMAKSKAVVSLLHGKSLAV
jgi:protein tyrosine phosphatase (PTP) superfamily phosphohydrolase (DUF442 family)